MVWAKILAVWVVGGAAVAVAQPQFVDRAAAVGIHGKNVSGTSQKYIVEGMMGGAAGPATLQLAEQIGIVHTHNATGAVDTKDL